MSGDRLAVGAPYDNGQSGNDTGAVYIFKRNSSDVWQLEKEISDKSTGFNKLETEDWFGYHVSLDGGRLAVGADGDDGSGDSNSGAVYIFELDSNNVWKLKQEFLKVLVWVVILVRTATLVLVFRWTVIDWRLVQILLLFISSKEAIRLGHMKHICPRVVALIVSRWTGDI